MLDRLLAFLERWRGLPVLLGAALVILNFAAGLIPGGSWLAWHDWLLHLGLVVALIGIVLTEAL